jgi:1-acyl-sn-glycerol-3-phosphate acyltransferase
VRGDQLLGDLGLDSLALVDLALALEDKTGRSIGDGELRLEMTVDQVRALVARAPTLDQAELIGRNDGPEAAGAEPSHWPYTWGRLFRFLSFPLELIYRLSVTHTVVLGGEHLANLPSRVIFAGTHHSRADVPLVRHALAEGPARRLAGRLVIAAAAGTFARGLLGQYGVLAFGLYPLRQYAARDVSLRGLARLAAAGNPILIFPQGTYARPAQERDRDPSVRFRPGVAHLAAALQVAVVPFGLAGTDRLLPPTLDKGYRGLVFAGRPLTITPGPLAIAFGAPLLLESGEPPQAFTDRLQEASYALTRQAEGALGLA